MDTEMKKKKNLFEEKPGQDEEKKQPVDENPGKEPEKTATKEKVPEQEEKTDPKKEPEFLKDFKLPKGTPIKDNRGIEYTVVGHKPSGNFGNIYEISDPGNRILILKEFYIRGGRRRKDLRLDFSKLKLDAFDKALDKFRKEAGRVLSIFQGRKRVATSVNDDMSYDQAFQAAKQEFNGPGGIFEWRRMIFSTYTLEEKANLNLVIPETDCFECYGNYYYIMEYVPGVTLLEYMRQFKDGKTKKNLDEILRIMEQLAIAIENIHRIPCVYMDMSAKNVMVDIVNGQVKLKVLDFGLAADLDKAREDIRITGELGGSVIEVCGTRGFSDVFYNSELYKAHPTNIDLVDIYSLGAMLYFMTIFQGADCWTEEMGADLSLEIRSMHTWQNRDYIPFSISENDSPDDSYRKMLLNECYALAKEATTSDPVDGFKDRIQSAGEFKNRIQKMLWRIHWKNKEGEKVGAAQEKTLLSFQTTGPWSARIEDNPDWVTIAEKPTGTDAGIHILPFNIQPNKTESPRKATVTIKCGIMQISTELIQEGVIRVEPATYLFFTDESSSEVTFKEEGGKKTLEFRTNKGVTVQVVPEDRDWLTADVSQGQGDYHTLTLQVAANEDSSTRKATVKLVGEGREIAATVEQAPKPVVLQPDKIVPKSSLNFRFKGDATASQSMAFSCNNDWKAEIEEGQDWIALEKTQGHAGDIQIPVTVTTNTTNNERTATVTITCGTARQSYTVLQEKINKVEEGDTEKTKKQKKIIALALAVVAAVVIYLLWGITPPPPEDTLDFPDGTTITIPHEGVEKTAFPLEASHLWKAEITEQQPEGWLTLDNASGDTTMKNFLYSAKMNTRHEPNQATVKVVCGDQTRILRVTQGVDRADSLEYQLANKDVSGIISFTEKDIKAGITLYEKDRYTGETKVSKENLLDILLKKNTGMIIGETHDVVEFAQDTEDKKIISITLQRRY